MLFESARKKEKAAEEGGTPRRRINLEPSGTSGLCLGITWHPCDKTNVLFVRQPSAAESFNEMGRRRWKSDGNRNTRRRHFTGSNRRALKKTNSRSSKVSGQGESALRRACKCRSRYPSRLGYFKQRNSHGIARKDESSILHMARTCWK